MFLKLEDLENRSMVTEFLLLGFSVPSEVKEALFAAFLLVYLLTLLGNLLITALIVISTNLHTPMYFFLFNVSCLDIGSASFTVPRMLVGLLVARNYIPFKECIAQVFGFAFLGVTEVFLLTAMCYDRYVAICLPLSYSVIMSGRFCILLLTISLLAGFLMSLVYTLQASRLPFCGDTVIDNFVCDFPNLLKLACADPLANQILLFALTGSVALITFLVIITSYVHIIRVILKIPSTEGRRKVFSTCSAHLVVLAMFYGTGAATHLKPSSISLGHEKLASLFYTVFAPMLNPIIYSLRNEEVKKAARKVMHRRQRAL
ncbi:olfactory receptor 8H3-like [Ambystoma mexicanum]|uniref:olfactory receptor 8H3-like n=1 Tax=Ambystoma mexicanum TaxID=8296 RepID=UPI0037E7ADF6